MKNHLVCLTLLLPILTSQDEIVKENQTENVTVAPDNIIQPTCSHTATVFFLHLQGCHGTYQRERVTALRKGDGFPHPYIKFVFPTAPYMPYQFLHGEKRNVWFDREVITEYLPEDKRTLNVSIIGLSKLIDDEVKSGIPLSRILIGGVDMGGTTALHMALRYYKRIPGVFIISGYLTIGSTLYEELSKHRCKSLPRVYFINSAGIYETATWTQNTLQRLKKYGVRGKLHAVGEEKGSINDKQLDYLWTWMEEMLGSRNSNEHDLSANNASLDSSTTP